MPSASSANFLSTGSRQADAVERAMALVCVCAVACVWLAGFSAGGAGRWRLLLEISVAMIAAVACAGAWLTNQVWDVPSRSFRRSIALSLARIQDLIRPGCHAEARVRLRPGDSGGLLLAVEAMANSEHVFGREIARGQTVTEDLHAGSDQALATAAALAEAVRAATSGIAGMIEGASRATEAASAAHAAFVAIADRSATLSAHADDLHHALQGVARQASGVSEGPIRASAESAIAMLDGLLATITGFTLEARRAEERVQSLAATIGKQHGGVEAIMRNVQAQAQDVATLLNDVSALRTGTGTMRKTIDALATLHQARHDSSIEVWRTVEAFPGRAETIARLLRGLPDFTPKMAFQGD